MKTPFAAIAASLLCCLAAAGPANAVTPKTGTWKVKLQGAPTPSGGAKRGTLTVVSKRGKLSVGSFNAPSFYVKCTGAGAQPKEIDPGFDGQFGLGGPIKIGKKGAFAGSSRFKAGSVRVQSASGKFTSQRKAKGTLRVRITGDASRTCDSGAVKFTASK